jgi:hypothetical protein
LKRAIFQHKCKNNYASNANANAATSNAATNAAAAAAATNAAAAATNAAAANDIRLYWNRLQWWFYNDLYLSA